MHTESKDEMRERILDAALKRFTHYGASKTTMNEIADDLGCSKASLYYYFPDKKAMHMAVLRRIGEAYFLEMEKAADNVTTVEETLLRILDIRREFIQRFCKLEIFRILRDTSSALMMEMTAAKKREIALATRVFQVGIDSGELKMNDPAATAELFVQAMIGLRFSISDDVRSDMDFEDEDFDLLVEKQKMLGEIFIKGLKA